MADEPVCMRGGVSALRGTATLFDNGSSSGPQRNLRNQAGSQEVFENFALSRPSIITTITWQQHAHDEATYHNTEVLIFRGAPFTGPSVFRATRVADRTPNATGTQFDRWDGFDYSLKDDCPSDLDRVPIGWG